MNLSKLKNKFSSKGFTLIELLVVIAILGILAAVVLIAINPGQRIAAARNARVRSDLGAMGQNANVVNADTGLNTACVTGGSYPTGFNTTTCTINYFVPTAPVAPNGAAYAYTAQTTAGGACTNASQATACAKISISGPAFTDGVIDASALTVWCWRSLGGTITQVTNAAACTP